MKQTGFINWIIMFVGICLLWSVAIAGDINYTKSDQSYSPNQRAVMFLRQITETIEIVVFHGTWCKDCQREIPRFKKVLETVNNPNILVKEYEVNPQKRDSLGKFEEYRITLVPTFIVIRDSQELGRITERPELSLEEDLAVILDWNAF